MTTPVCVSTPISLPVTKHNGLIYSTQNDSIPSIAESASAGKIFMIVFFISFYVCYVISSEEDYGI